MLQVLLWPCTFFNDKDRVDSQKESEGKQKKGIVVACGAGGQGKEIGWLGIYGGR